MNRAYDFKAVEEKWRPIWRESGLYATGSDPEKPKHYILDFFPYPSGAGLSVGHCRNYVPTCISARYMRMKGYNVLHPMGWDSFGLPAENYAIEHGVHPRITTRRHEATYRRQMELVECSYDWSREFSSTDPAYYRWTQWFFLLLYRRGLAYRAAGSQWWCPQCQTILANEQVEGGRCWRCGSQVTKKTLQQWYFKITDYADRLIADLEQVDWPESIKAMQRNWIGRSEGAEIVFQVEKPDGDGVWEIETFTTRPDTLFGATFLALAPEHPLATAVATPERQEAVAEYVEQAQQQTEIDRLSAARPKTGAFTGRHAVHPFTGEPVPIWVADYVLTGYGSGAIMGVPGHDERDHAFARQYGLAVKQVIRPAGVEEGGQLGGQSDEDDCFTGPGIMINSGRYSGLDSREGAAEICADLEALGAGQRAVTYKMRDWLISRQRYWGTPIPIVHCPACGTVPVPEEELPVLLPQVEEFAPAGDGRSPLARAEEWVNTACPQCGGPAERETDTMDGFACSSWYFLRFASPHEEEAPFDREAVAYWLPVDVYVGGAEHAVMHLLYARFWTKVMYDAGLVDFVEPFATLRNQGVLHAADGRRMSKSRGNVITPDEVIEEHGTDALRTYVVFIGPFEANVIWDDAGIKGVTRFLDRFWALANAVVSRGDQREETGTDGDGAFARTMHRAIKRITEDVEAFKFNTAVAALMEWLNALYEARGEGVSVEAWREAIETFSLLLAPFAPFIAEEVWREVLGHEASVHRQSWPEYDEEQIQGGEITVAVQVNGRLRDTITVPAGIADDDLEEAALASANVQRHVDGRPIRKTIVVSQQLVNFVV